MKWFIAIIALLFVSCSKPEIVILDETFYEDVLNGGNCLVVEYAIGGHYYSATFRRGQEMAYYNFMKHLESQGRIVK